MSNAPHTGSFDLTIQSHEFAEGLTAGYRRFQTGYQGKVLTDEDVYTFCLRNCLDGHDPKRYNVGYITGWLLALFHLELPTSQTDQGASPPVMQVGNALIHLTDGEEFRTGYQAG